MMFRVESVLLNDARPERAQEWRLALMDLNSECDASACTVILDATTEGGVTVRIDTAETSESLAFEPAALRRHFREYAKIIRQLSRAGYGYRDMETLDYAKKLAHDEAGETIADTLSPHLTLSHRVARKLFTLFFLLCHETPANLVNRHGLR